LIDPSNLEFSDCCLGFLEQMKKETTETITKIRSNTDAAENQRRIQEEKMKKDR
jgi:hypothetical protein